MLDQAWQSCSEAEKAQLSAVVGKAMAPLPPFRSTPPKGPGRQWQLDEAASLAKNGLQKRDFAAGRNLFHAVGCASCHRFAGEGGGIGPDLTSLGNKFAARDVLESILEPSKVVSDQYAGKVVKRKDGTSLFGHPVEVRENGTLVGYDVWPAAADPKPVRVALAELAALEPSPLSPMPAALADPLAPGELLDLLAFLLSRGDPQGPLFR
jgi:putative heme-binding domain-containing protein